MNNDKLYEVLQALIEKNDERMDKTMQMVTMLVETCSKNMEVYDKHLYSLEQSRNIAQENAAKSIEVNKNLTEMMTNQREDYQSHLAALREELHRLRDEYRIEVRELHDGYQALTQAYTRLAERSGGSKSEVNINQ